MDSRKGFTVIELLIVMAILAAVMAASFSLLEGLWQEKVTSSPILSLEGITEKARNLAVQEKKIVVMEINLEEQTIGLRDFNAEQEAQAEKTTAELWIGRDNRTRQVRDELLSEKSLQEDFTPSKNWIYQPVPLKSPIEKAYSISGAEVTGPFIAIRFYPNGFSDSLGLLMKGTPTILLIPSVNASIRKISYQEFSTAILPTKKE